MRFDLTDEEQRHCLLLLIEVLDYADAQWDPVYDLAHEPIFKEIRLFLTQTGNYQNA